MKTCVQCCVQGTKETLFLAATKAALKHVYLVLQQWSVSLVLQQTSWNIHLYNCACTFGQELVQNNFPTIHFVSKHLKGKVTIFLALKLLTLHGRAYHWLACTSKLTVAEPRCLSFFCSSWIRASKALMMSCGEKKTPIQCMHHDAKH